MTEVRESGDTIVDYSSAVDERCVPDAQAQAHDDQLLPPTNTTDLLRADRDDELPLDRPVIPAQHTSNGETVAEIEQPRGPYYEQLMNDGDAGIALVPYLNRLAITASDYCTRTDDNRDAGDELDRGLLDRLSDDDGAIGNNQSGQLTDILGHSLQALREHPDLVQDGAVNWLGLSNSLLDSVSELGDAVTDERHTLLVSATTAALMSDNPEDRITFLERTSERELNFQMQRALNESDVTLIFDGCRNADIRSTNHNPDRSIHRMKHFSNAFEVKQSDVARYRELTELTDVPYVDAHAAMRDMITDYQTSDSAAHGDYANTLEAVSVSPTYVDKFRVDPTKAERFALEEMFVKAQMAELFPDGDTIQFQDELASQRSVDVDTDIDVDTLLQQFFKETQDVIGKLSEHAVKRFNIPDGRPNDTWTSEQLAAWRYKEVAKKGYAYDHVVRFVDPTLAGPTANISSEISSVSRNGAALPAITTEAVRTVIQMAKAYEAANNERISAEELLELTQANRRQLMKVAAINVDHLSASIVNGNIRNQLPYGKIEPSMPASNIYRGKDGILGIDGPIYKTATSSTLAGARLACVALRVNIEMKPDEDDPQDTSKINSIELFSTLVFNEAYERGLFKINMATAA